MGIATDKISVGCGQCKWLEVEVGDSVPYGSTTVKLPDYEFCVCPNVSDAEIGGKCESTKFGESCIYFERQLC